MSADLDSQRARRDRWFEQVRTNIGKWVDSDGSGKLPQFNAPYREPVWVLPALYSGNSEAIDLANRMVARYHDVQSVHSKDLGARSGKMFNIFQTNCFAHLYFQYRSLLSPGAEEVMRWHTEQTVRTFAGSAQPDFVFRGGNDNMPAHATSGLVMAGQALGDKGAIEHARWNLRQLRQLFARNAWISEFNSSTYSSLTITSLAAIAEHAEDEEIRDLAMQIEHRLWAEILLHYHPGTLHQAGPMSRAYAIDYAGHNHNLQSVMWHTFGEEVTGRDLIASYFHPDDKEVVHFGGCYAQSIAEYTTAISVDMHVPADLERLATERSYPVKLSGRAEIQLSYESAATAYTQTYMEESYSLGSCSRPMCGGEPTASLYLTYRRVPKLRNWRDAATAFVRYSNATTPAGQKESSADGHYSSDAFVRNDAWMHVTQRDNTAVLLSVPNLRFAPVESSSLKLSLVFPAHFGQIRSSIIGDESLQAGAVGESVEVCPVSIETGEVYVHVQPLIPTNLTRRSAVRFSRQNEYEVLELINYEGDPRIFDRVELSRVLNGMVLTVDETRKYASLADFHREKSAARIVDYLFVGTRFFEFHRSDGWFRIALSTDTMGVMTELIDGLPRPMPILETNQIDISTLPFLGERSTPNFPFFPWEKMEIMEWANSWIIGSRGLPDEPPYSNRVDALVPEPDGPRRAMLPEQVLKEDKRKELAAKLNAETKRF